MTNPPVDAQYSEDGHYWWDGSAWQPVAAAGDVADSFQQQWGAEIERLRRMFAEQRYGCWCGPGHTCNEETDQIDHCCHQHDEAYNSLGVTSDDPPAPGAVGMWTVDGFKRTVAADAQLVACVTATEFDTHFYGPEAALYRGGVQTIFGGRAVIAAWLITNGY